MAKVAEFFTPQPQCEISISSWCRASRDSPRTPDIFKNMSAISRPSDIDARSGLQMSTARHARQFKPPGLFFLRRLICDTIDPVSLNPAILDLFAFGVACRIHAFVADMRPLSLDIMLHA